MLSLRANIIKKNSINSIGNNHHIVMNKNHSSKSIVHLKAGIPIKDFVFFYSFDFKFISNILVSNHVFFVDVFQHTPFVCFSLNELNWFQRAIKCNLSKKKTMIIYLREILFCCRLQLVVGSKNCKVSSH